MADLSADTSISVQPKSTGCSLEVFTFLDLNRTIDGMDA